MTLEPLLDAPLVVQAHVLAAIPARLFGPVALWRRRRDGLHRAIGRIWVAAMATLVLTDLRIPSAGLALIGPVGPIHARSVVTLWACGRAWPTPARGGSRRTATRCAGCTSARCGTPGPSR